MTGTAPARQGLPGTVGTITRTGGSRQLTYNGQPLYTYIGDSAPGQAAATTSTSTADCGTKCLSPDKTQRHIHVQVVEQCPVGTVRRRDVPVAGGGPWIPGHGPLLRSG